MVIYGVRKQPFTMRVPHNSKQTQLRDDLPAADCGRLLSRKILIVDELS